MTENSLELVEALKEWVQAFMHHSMDGFVTFAKQQSLSLHQFGALFHIQRTGGCPVSDISHDLGITTAAVSQMLERLVQHGLIVRTEDPNDRRVKRIDLTDEGHRIVHESITARQRWFGDLAAAMLPAERQQATRALKMLASHANSLEDIDR